MLKSGLRRRRPTAQHHLHRRTPSQLNETLQATHPYFAVKTLSPGHPMNNFHSDRSSRSGTAGAHRDSFVHAPADGASARFADDDFDVDSWLGYESIHPLTWVPVHVSAESGLGVE